MQAIIENFCPCIGFLARGIWVLKDVRESSSLPIRGWGVGKNNVNLSILLYLIFSLHFNSL